MSVKMAAMGIWDSSAVSAIAGSLTTGGFLIMQARFNARDRTAERHEQRRIGRAARARESFLSVADALQDLTMACNEYVAEAKDAAKPDSHRVAFRPKGPLDPELLARVGRAWNRARIDIDVAAGVTQRQIVSSVHRLSLMETGTYYVEGDRLDATLFHAEGELAGLERAVQEHVSMLEAEVKRLDQTPAARRRRRRGTTSAT